MTLLCLCVCVQTRTRTHMNTCTVCRPCGECLASPRAKASGRRRCFPSETAAALETSYVSCGRRRLGGWYCCILEDPLKAASPSGDWIQLLGERTGRDLGKPESACLGHLLPPQADLLDLSEQTHSDCQKKCFGFIFTFGFFFLFWK